MNTKKGPWKDWVTLRADGCWETYGGVWAKKDPNDTAGVYYVIEHTDMADACGNDHDPTERYIASVSRVDLSEVSPDDLRSALDCCGISKEDLTDLSFDQRELAIVDALVSYGSRSPMGQFADAHYPERSRAAARREVESLMRDSAYLETVLDRPVNALGTTAREFATDVLAGLRRYEDDGLHGTDQTKDIMLKIYGGSVRSVK